MKIIYYLKFVALSVFYIFDLGLVVVFSAFEYATERAKLKIKSNLELKGNRVLCKVCNEYFKPENQVGICPHENFNNWLGIGSSKEEQEELEKILKEIH